VGRMTTTTAHRLGATNSSRRELIIARVLLVPLAFLTTVGAIVFDGLSAFGIVLLSAAAVYLATVIFGGRSRGVRIAALGVLPLHFLFNVTKVAGGEVFSVVFLVLIAVSTALLARSLRDGSAV
jgi:hypothetical protein